MDPSSSMGAAATLQAGRSAAITPSSEWDKRNVKGQTFGQRKTAAAQKTGCQIRAYAEQVYFL